MLLAEKINNLEKQEIKIKDQLCQIASLTFQIEDLKSARESLLNVNTELKLKQNDWESHVVNSNSKLKAMQDLIGNLKNENSKLMLEIQATSEKHNNIVLNINQEHQEKVNKLKEKVTFLKKEIQRWNFDDSFLLNSKLTDENQRLQNLLIQKEDTIFKLSNDFEQFKLSSAETKEHLKNKVKNLESEKLQHSEQFMQKEKSEIGLQNLMTQQEMKIMMLEKQLKEREREVKEREEELSGHNNECEQNKREMINKSKCFLQDFQQLIQSIKLKTIPVVKIQDTKEIVLENVFEEVLENTKLIISVHMKCQQEKIASNGDLNNLIESMKSEIEKNRIEMNNEKLKKDKLKRINKEMTEKASSLEMRLQDAEKCLKQDTNNHEKKIEQLIQQVKSFKRETSFKDSIISDMVFHFDKELANSTHKFKELWSEYESQNARISNLVKKEKEFEQQADELKNLLKESHLREEQTRELLREKHDSSRSSYRSLEDAKHLLKATRESTNTKQQHQSTKHLSESAEKQIEVLKSQKYKDKNISSSKHNAKQISK